MRELPTPSDPRSAPRPRWGVLYAALAAVMLLGLVGEFLVPDGPLRVLLRTAVALGDIAVMALWVRANAIALGGGPDWCARARATLTEPVDPPTPLAGRTVPTEEPGYSVTSR